MDYTVSVYHDHRNAVSIYQSVAAAGVSSNVNKKYSLSFNGAATGELTSQGNGFLNSTTNPKNPKLCVNRPAQGDAKTPYGCWEE